MKRAFLIASLLLPPASALAQADTITPRRLFTGQDAALAGAFIVGGYFTRPLDKHFAQRLQRPGTQERQFLQKSARIFNATAVPGAFIIGGGLYVGGRVAKSHKLADLGLHSTEALLIGEV